MDLIPKNYQEMISIPGNQDNELNKFFETIDNLNKPFKLNESKFGLNIRDENGNSILHRIIINSLNEQELLNKIQFIPNIETLINTVNFKHQSPLHLLCKYQYYQAYLLLKNTLEGNEIDYLKEEMDIEILIKSDSSIITKKDKGKEDIKYDILDSKNRLPLSYLVMGVDIDKIRASNVLIPEDIKSTDTNLNKMRQRFGLGTITVPSIPAGTTAQAAHINNLNTAMNNAYTAARNKNYNNVASFTSFAVTAGSLILASTDTNIDAILAGWNAACVNQSVNGTNGTNDTFSDFGDNDTLSALVLALIEGDLLILLSDIDGLYTDDPNRNPDAKFISYVDKLEDSLLEMAKGPSTISGTGGMSSKLSAARISAEAGSDMIIANGSNIYILEDIMNGIDVGTYFKIGR